MQAGDWRVVHGDTFMLGDCFALDISDKIGPGKPWNLGLVRKRTDNLKIQRPQTTHGRRLFSRGGGEYLKICSNPPKWL